MCEHCGKPRNKNATRFCSIQCQKDYEYSEYLKLWFSGNVDGFRGTRKCALSQHIRRFVLERSEHCCEQCGWNTPHPTTGKPPLDIHHIDGNSQNNRPENLQALCPNCHSLTLSYRNLNRGKGRKMR